MDRHPDLGDPELQAMQQIALNNAIARQAAEDRARAERMANPPPYDELDPGIRETVRWLFERGFDPTDSGDGSKAATMGCAESEPNVYMLVKDPHQLIHETDRLGRLLTSRGIVGRVQGSYAPGEPAIIALHGVADSDLPTNETT